MSKVKGATAKTVSKQCPVCKSESCSRISNCYQFKALTRPERWAIIKENKLCSRCLGAHQFYRCRSKQDCSVEGCKFKHHTLLHNNDKPVSFSSTNENEKKPSNITRNKVSKSKEKPVVSKVQDSPVVCNSQRSSINQRTDIFRIIPIMIFYKRKTFRTFAYLDDGSNLTLMENDLANEIGIDGTPDALCVDWAFGQTDQSQESKIVSTTISGFFDRAPKFKLNNVRTVKNLHLPTQSITQQWIDQYSHLQNIPISTYESVKPRMLIGLQYSKLMVSFETVEGKDNEPIACRTRLGWVIQGPSYQDGENSQAKTFSLNICECQSKDNQLHQLVKQYFAMESCDVKINEKILESKEIQRAKRILESTTIKKDGRYETGLLWKIDQPEIPDTYSMARKRLRCLESKMVKNPQLAQNLCTQIKQFMEKGYIRKLSPIELKDDSQLVCYLPIFPVFNPKKPEKTRIVWDAAAKVNGVSLNSLLSSGPDMLVSLVDVLRRFRERKIAITGDIKEMYHQIRIRDSDQNAQRFLWRDGDTTKEPEVYVMQVMTFGSTCSPSAAQFVKNKNAIEFKDKYPRAVEAVINNHYVDDMIDSTHTTKEAVELIKNVKEIHSKAGFEIRNFISNSKELLEAIGENVDQKDKDLNISIELGTERVLGMFWQTGSDTFTFSLKFAQVNKEILDGSYCPTKREVLRILMSVFDPMGFLANFLVYAKILLQEIWRSNIAWDEKLTTSVQSKWIQWIKALPNVENIQIPRLYSEKLSPEPPKSIQLHIFVDASEEAYAAAAYLRISDETGVDCSLVGAKTKVAPNKPMSIPRLELQGGVLGTRLATSIVSSLTLPIVKRIFWSDSQTVMGWINSEARKYNQFVSFRIGEILESSDQNEWRWIPTQHNVADEATKSREIPKLDSSSRWFKAPEFLYDDDETWFTDGNVEYDTDEELRPRFVMTCVDIRQEKLIEIERFSQWNRLLNAQAYVFRFISNARCELNKRQLGPLSQEELIKAENCLYHRAQRDCFLDEILIMKHNQKVPLEQQKGFDKSSLLPSFSPYLDEHNVIRMKGRIDAATMIPQETKRPVILPRRHYITKLIVDYYHRLYKHVNHSTALNEINQKYQIPALRVVMKGIRSSCQLCRNASVIPQIPEMAELPPARLAVYTRPFTYVGVDYFGPMRVKVTRNQIHKRWGVLFTCMTSRAVHLEIAHSLDTGSCIMSVRNFMGRRGRPREIYSDNGSNFHGADNELRAEFEKMNKDKVEEEFTNTQMKWKFNPPASAHMGGAWERLIGTVKNCLRQIMKTRTPTDEMLTSLFIEVENIVNSRPLTYMSLESADQEALTPNHLLLGSSNGSKAPGQFTEKDLARNTWKAVQVFADNFWHRFVLEYLPTLTKRTKWFKPAEPIKIGDVVVIIDEKEDRNSYPKGIVEELLPGKKGQVRQVMVRTTRKVYRRSVGKLAVLDVKPPNEVMEVQLMPRESVNEGEYVGQH